MQIGLEARPLVEIKYGSSSCRSRYAVAATNYTVLFGSQLMIGDRDDKLGNGLVNWQNYLPPGSIQYFDLIIISLLRLNSKTTLKYISRDSKLDNSFESTRHVFLILG